MTTQPTTAMKRSWLVQRLNPPHEGGQFGAMQETFSFGGGLRNGGLSGEAMGLLRGIFSFDYMGAAEFEFGAVPEALNLLARNTRGLRAIHHPAINEVGVLAQQVHMDEVCERIFRWASDPHSDDAHTKERVYLKQALEGDEWVRARGWLELDNGFMFFTDQQMFERSCALFGVKAVSA